MTSNLYATLTFSNNLTVMQNVAEIIDDELNFFKKNAFFTYAAVQFQPLPRIFTLHSLERGGNVLGLDRYKNNNIIFLLDLAWNGTKFDAEIRRLADRVMTNLTTYLQKEGALRDFQYINYSFQDQDPLGGYGVAALNKIKAASKKYDPSQVFQRLVPGGFKLRDAGNGTSIGLP